MAVKFWLGGEQSDKSHKMFEYILKEAEEHPDRHYLVVAPDQAGLATQRELVLASKNKGILNVDVLSFLRLAHRIGEEVGSYDSTVTILDDMGKNLLLSLIANRKRDELTVFGDNIDKLGYITQIKSVISEFMQYGVNADKVNELAECAKGSGKGLLAAKLSDISLIYKSFLEYIQDRYTTTEEILARLSAIVPYSDTLKNSVVIFDGFTGFTHVQLELIGKLMEYVRDIHVALLLEQEDSAEDSGGEDKAGDVNSKEHELFHLSKVTIGKIEKLAEERRINVLDSYQAGKATDKPELNIISGQNPNEEVRITASVIRKLIKEKGYRYSDIAIVTGDLEGYRKRIDRIFPGYDIEYFVDRTEAMLLNPFVEYIRSILDVFAENFSYESMFRFLKSGMTNFSDEEINRLDNYCLATGVRGSKKWHTRFDRPSRDENGEQLLELEELRKRIIDKLDAFSADVDLCSQNEKASNADSNDIRLITAATKSNVRSFAIALYNRIVAENIEEKLRTMSDVFSRDGDIQKSEEYGQIYVRIMKSLEELVMLIPDETVTIRQFRDLLSAALDSIRIGVAPKSMDYVQVGDLTRSRIGKVKALFIMGVNDGIIPSPATGGGIINDGEKEFLLNGDPDLILAPTAKEDAYTQRLYLYMAMNRPKEQLYLSYARVSSAGKTQMPSYIIRQSMKENPDYKRLNETDTETTVTKDEAYAELTGLLGKVAGRTLDKEQMARIRELMEYFLSDDTYSDRLQKLIWHTLIRPTVCNEDSIGKAVAKVIYGNSIVGSVTRLETYANCAYQYFIQYGLRLKDRELFDFEARDLGTILHESLSEFSTIMNKNGSDWHTVSEDDCNKYMDEAVETTIRKQHMGALYSSARMTYTVNRIRRIMQCTSSVISGQVKKGLFKPKYFEIGFEEMKNLKSLNIQLTDSEYMRLYGRIDRVDTYDADEGIYVKIIDYKSTQKDVDLAAIYEGRQLQLLVYLNAAMEYEANKSGKNAIPAGILYYHIDNPIIEDSGEMQEEKIKEAIFKKFKLSGLVNGDDNGRIVNLMDADFEKNSTWSTIVSAHRDKDGIAKEEHSLISGEKFNVLREFVNWRISESGRKILDGDIGIPVPDGQTRFTEPNCKYCEFKAICTNRVNGLEADEGEQVSESKLEDNEAIELMKTALTTDSDK